MVTSKPSISIIAALGARNRAIGREGKLLWHIPDDLTRFKRLTKGHPVIMGRKTFDSIVSYLGGPLPERTNVVITRSPDTIASPDVVASSSLEEALAKAREHDQQEIFVAGGGEIYEQALPHVDRMYLTLIDDTKDADTFFPPYEDAFTKEISREQREFNGVKYAWLTLGR